MTVRWTHLAGATAALLLAGIAPLQAEYRIDPIRFPNTVVPEVGALAFNPDGELVVALRRHGVLIAQPTADPAAFPWRVFAADMMHNPCGMQVLDNGDVIVSQMPELTRIRDTDTDGVADDYSTVSDGWGVSGNYHETIALSPDRAGGWYLAIGTASHNGPTFFRTRGEFAPFGRTGRNYAAVQWKGWVLHVDADGTTTPFAKGFRAHNGLLYDDAGRLWATDNQGDWRGTSPLYHVEQDKFYGHPSALVWDEKFVREVSDDPLQLYIDDWERYERDRTPAAVEFPHGSMCNSPSEPIQIPAGGPLDAFAGQMLVGDVAGDRVLRVMVEEVDGVMQGACVKFIDGGLGAGNNRLVFSPDLRDLYVGQTIRGWGNSPSEGLKRVTFDDETPFAVHHVSLLPDGFRFTFTTPLDPASLSKDATEFGIKRFWYKSHHGYGSPQHDVTSLTAGTVELSANGRELTVRCDGLETRRLFELTLPVALRSNDGRELDHRTLVYTVNKLAR